MQEEYEINRTSFSTELPLIFVDRKLISRRARYGGNSQPWRGSGGNWNFPVTFAYLREGQFHVKSHELIDAFLIVLLTEHKVLYCYATNVVCRCMVVGQ